MLPLLQKSQLSVLGLPQDDVDTAIDSDLGSSQRQGHLDPIHDDFHNQVANRRPRLFCADQCLVRSRDYMADIYHHRSVANLSAVQADLLDYFVVPPVALQYYATLAAHSVLLRSFLLHGHICRIDCSQHGS